MNWIKSHTVLIIAIAVLAVLGAWVGRSWFLSHVASNASAAAVKADQVATPAAAAATTALAAATQMQPKVDRAAATVTRAKAKLKQDQAAPQVFLNSQENPTAQVSPLEGENPSPVVDADKDSLIAALETQVSFLEQQVAALKAAATDYLTAVTAYKTEIASLHIQIAALKADGSPWTALAIYGTGGIEGAAVTYTWHALTGGALAVKHNVGGGQTTTDVAVTAGVRF